MSMMAVVYHYVRPGIDSPPYEYFHLRLEDFRKQLDYLQRGFNLISLQAFVDCIKGERSPREDDVVLTFDDGFFDHYEWVFPELKSRGLWGLFFVPGPVEGLLPVHRVHRLLGSASAVELLTSLSELVDASILDNYSAMATDGNSITSNSSEYISTFKRLINYTIPPNRVSEVLGELESRHLDKENMRDNFYLSPAQIEEMAASGMIIGGHSVNHPVLSRLSPEEQRKEITTSLKFVDEVAGPQPVRSFAYPFGGADTFNPYTIEIVRRSGCDVAFTSEAGEIQSDDFDSASLTLARRDCNEFPHGSASRT